MSLQCPCRPHLFSYPNQSLKHARTLVTPPDPTKPNSHPDLDSALAKESSNTFLYLVGVTGAAVGVWYYMRLQGEDVHAKTKENEERIKKKAQELKEAGKQTAHDAVTEGHQDYHDVKVRPFFLDLRGYASYRDVDELCIGDGLCLDLGQGEVSSSSGICCHGFF